MKECSDKKMGAGPEQTSTVHSRDKRITLFNCCKSESGEPIGRSRLVMTSEAGLEGEQLTAALVADRRVLFRPIKGKSLSILTPKANLASARHDSSGQSY